MKSKQSSKIEKTTFKKKLPPPSKSEIFELIENNTSIKILQIENLGNGLAYCRLFELLYPGSISIKNLKLQPKIEGDFLHNLKLLQNGFQKYKLAKCKFQDNFAFAQFFIRFFEENKLNQFSPIKKVKTNDQQRDNQLDLPSFSIFDNSEENKPAPPRSSSIYMTYNKQNFLDNSSLKLKEIDQNYGGSMLVSPIKGHSDNFLQREDQFSHLMSNIKRIDDILDKIKLDDIYN